MEQATGTRFRNPRDILNDPMTDGRLGYLHTAEGVVIYSVGPDQADDLAPALTSLTNARAGGKEVPPRNAHFSNWQGMHYDDIHFELRDIRAKE